MGRMLRVVFAVAGALLLVHAWRTWRLRTMPGVLGRDDAEYWGERQPKLRSLNLAFLTFFGVLMLIAAVFGRR
jgi:hypothetical protein